MSRALFIESHASPEPRIESHDSAVRRLLVVLGRTLFAAIFLIDGPQHFMPGTIEFAASQGIPFAWVLVPVSGAMATLGGLSVLFGYHTRIGAALLIAFLVPVTLVMHAFWRIPDPMTAGIQEAMFFKNLSMIGGALLVAQLGARPGRLSARR